MCPTTMPAGPNRALLTQDRGEPLQALARRHFAALGRVAERVNVGDLVQAQRLRRAFGQRHALAACRRAA